MQHRLSLLLHSICQLDTSTIIIFWHFSGELWDQLFNVMVLAPVMPKIVCAFGWWMLPCFAHAGVRRAGLDLRLALAICFGNKWDNVPHSCCLISPELYLHISTLHNSDSELICHANTKIEKVKSCCMLVAWQWYPMISCL